MKTILFILILTCTQLFAQQDPKAKAILDRLSEKNKKFESMQVKFNYIIENLQSQKIDKHEGNISIKADKYKLFMMKNEIYYDGKSLTTYMTESNEANISNANPNDKTTLNPAKFMTIYESGFKYKLLGEKKIGTVLCHEIDLIPNDIKGKKYSRVILYVDKAAMQIKSIQSVGKDGISLTVEVLDFKPNVPMDDKTFTFDAKAHPGVGINDVRE